MSKEKRFSLLNKAWWMNMRFCLRGDEIMTKEIVVNGEESAVANVMALNLQTKPGGFARRKFLKISPTLLKLHDLRHLDLSSDDFG
ncbi:hypothetical protein WN944_024248 [Citrus x changshan-huyou]|uniref:Uncharacterized protein n=1 Tax=Citrus x changshan-huyou TaxID=2935761 RepID=A0AAP0LNB0_9ROSI